MERKDNLLDVLKALFRWKKQILTVCIIAFVGSVILSLLMPVYYQSTTTFLAASPDLAKPELLYGNGNFEPEYYGNKSDIDRLLTLAESSELVNFLIDSFKLYDHYGIDSSGARAPFKVKEKLFGLYEVQKTKRDAIELSVEDKDKVLAAEMANAAREKIDELAQRLIKEGQYKSITAYAFNISSKEEQLATLSDSLARLRRLYGIYNTDAQTESMTEQFSRAESKLVRNQARLEALRSSGRAKADTLLALDAMVEGQVQEVIKLEERLGKLNEGMAMVNTINKQYLEANQSLGQDKERYKILVSTYKSDIPAIIPVEKASVPLVKSRPKRMIIVFAAVAIAFLFSIVTVLLIESYKEINWREIINA